MNLFNSLSTMLGLYHSGQFYLYRKPRYLENTMYLPQVIVKPYHSYSYIENTSPWARFDLKHTLPWARFELKTFVAYALVTLHGIYQTTVRIITAMIVP